MDPLRGRAEQISAKTAAVINMNTMEMIYEDLDCISGNTRIHEGALDFYQTAAGPPASKPKKKPALFAALFPNSDAHRVLSWLRVPNPADKVHCNETRGEAFDEVPATVELL